MSAIEELEGGSVWDEEVYNAFRAHVEEEGQLLSRYQQLVSASDSSDVAYLVRAIMDDEQRHHAMFEQLADSVRNVVELSPSRSGVPDVPLRRAGAGALREALGELLRFEHEDAKRLRQLRRTLKPVAETTIWPLLIETMQLDTKKHILILKHLQQISGGVFGD